MSFCSCCWNSHRQKSERARLIPSHLLAACLPGAHALFPVPTTRPTTQTNEMPKFAVETRRNGTTYSSPRLSFPRRFADLGSHSLFVSLAVPPKTPERGRCLPCKGAPWILLLDTLTQDWFWLFTQTNFWPLPVKGLSTGSWLIKTQNHGSGHCSYYFS